MAGPYQAGARSTLAINGHPIHPMLVPFPIAFLIGALASDLVFLGTADPFWARASAWLIGAGLVMGALAAVVGLIEFVTIARARALTGWMHFIGNAVAMLVALANLLVRLGDLTGAVLPTGLILSIVTTVILIATGWLGGELTYRMKIGVIEEGAVQPAAQAAGDLAFAGQRPETRGPPNTPLL
jgi:uncharacterized membrane protein